jgi:hypothetical protein
MDFSLHFSKYLILLSFLELGEIAPKLSNPSESPANAAFGVCPGKFPTKLSTAEVEIFKSPFES